MTILVVVAHPDDEVLGCGGSIAKWVAAGKNVHVLILAEGVTSRDVSRDRELRTFELSKLSTAAQSVGALLGVVSVKLMNFPDNRMDTVDRLEVVKAIEDQVTILRPEVLVTHHAGDVNIDHRIVTDACIVACRPQPGQSVKRVLSFEVPSSTEWYPPSGGINFCPNWFEDISGFLEKKTSALELYVDELRPWPHPRSLEAVRHLANWRGASVGCKAAEAFVVLREVR